jgi:hypothetical protein
MKMGVFDGATIAFSGIRSGPSKSLKRREAVTTTIDERDGWVADCTRSRISAASRSFPFLNSDISSWGDKQIGLDRPVDQILNTLHAEL